MITAASPLHITTVGVHLESGSSLVNLLPHLVPSGVWIREGRGLIGLGTAAATAASGHSRFAQLSRWWESLPLVEDADPLSTASTSSAQLNSPPTSSAPTGVGPGPVAFTSITYSADSEHASALIVPELLISSTEEGVWLTAVAPEGAALADLLSAHGLQLHGSVLSLSRPAPAQPLPPAEQQPGSQSQRHYLDAVAAGLGAIDEGEVEKLVLARDVLVRAADPLPVGPLLSRLAADYADCWTYLVSDALGATPEMLVSVRGEEVFSRVLAGTVDHDMQVQQAHDGLLRDLKQHREHELAVLSLLDQLSPVTQSLSSPAEPRVMELPNVYHLATDITGRLKRDHDGELPPALLVAKHAHPTAAVCGTPTPQADQLLASLEGLDRGPFAGPVGWIDTRGNADFGIALRGGVLEDESTVRLYAGCGVVAGSEPESELAETHSKLRVMLTALGA